LQERKKNTELRELLIMEPVSLVIKNGILRQFVDVGCRADADLVKKHCMMMKRDGTRQRGRQRKTL